jgi:hypothetical protein
LFVSVRAPLLFTASFFTTPSQMPQGLPST